MSESVEQPEQARVSCTDCHFSKVVDNVGDKPAMVTIEHGRETGHKLTTEVLVAE